MCLEVDIFNKRLRTRQTFVYRFIINEEYAKQLKLLYMCVCLKYFGSVIVKEQKKKRIFFGIL